MTANASPTPNEGELPAMNAEQAAEKIKERCKPRQRASEIAGIIREAIPAASQLADARAECERLKAIVDGVADALDCDEGDDIVRAAGSSYDFNDRMLIVESQLRTRAESAESALTAATELAASHAAELERARETVAIVLGSLEWNGDGYEWTGGQYDYRMTPGEAVAATERLIAGLRAQLTAAQAEAAALRGVLAKLKEVIDGMEQFYARYPGSSDPNVSAYATFNWLREQAAAAELAKGEA